MQSAAQYTTNSRRIAFAAILSSFIWAPAADWFTLSSIGWLLIGNSLGSFMVGICDQA